MGSFHLAKLAILALLLISAIAPSYETKVYMVMEEKVEEVTKMEKFVNGQLGCVNAGSYCHSIFGPKCCSGICLASPVFGGVCVG